ncbi:MAG TPA: response regulator FixJ [Stellaceae bacterium]|nr:response regulator FixJ [Stellaceae bacterium]
MPDDRHVYIVDDDEAVRDSISVLLEACGYTVHSYSAAKEFLNAAPTVPIGCLIVDIRMPEMDGLELQRHLNDRSLAFPTIVVTGHGDVPLAVRAMKAGALDFIEKPFSSQAILGSVEAALTKEQSGSEARDPVAAAAAAKLELLSPREREVLQGLLTGLPNKSIAYDLAISPRTVEIHRARVMDKMGARSLSELIRLALAAGLEAK